MSSFLGDDAAAAYQFGKFLELLRVGELPTLPNLDTSGPTMCACF
jgi:hypothetical protein